MRDDALLGIRLLLLLAAANTAPLVAKRALKQRWTAPLDGGLRFIDGRPLLGPSKTVRGLASAVLACAVLAPVLAFAPWAGALLGLLAMLGDALSSFVKRRLALPSSSRAPGLDQVPEALVPMLAAHALLGASWPLVLAVTLAFALLEPPLARLSHRAGLRDEPY